MCYSEIENSIYHNQIEQAMNRISEMLKVNPCDGRLYFYFGLCMDGINQKKFAGECFRVAYKNGYKSSNMLILLAKAESSIGNKEDAEKYFKEAIEYNTSEAEELCSKSEYAMFLIDNNQLLAAEKISRIIIEKYPNYYTGYHIYLSIKIHRKDYKACELLIEEIKEKFDATEDFLTDYIEFYQHKNGIEKAIDYMRNNEVYNRIIPQYVQKKNLEYYYSIEDFENYLKTLLALVVDYGDKDAAMAAMLLLNASKKYKLSAKIAEYIMDNEKEKQGFRFFMALEIQMFNYYYMANNHPSEKLVRWIEQVGKWCMAYAYENFPIKMAEIFSENIHELFDDINQISLVNSTNIS